MRCPMTDSCSYLHFAFGLHGRTFGQVRSFATDRSAATRRRVVPLNIEHDVRLLFRFG